MKKNKATLFFAGTSGLTLPVPNKSAYPAAFRDKSRLFFYASIFNTIEVNSTFKKIPMQRTIEKWAESVPENFRFTFKLWKGITHNKELVFMKEDVLHFMHVISAAGKRSGCLLIQFPGKITVTKAPSLRVLLDIIRNANHSGQWKIAVEFRNSSWYRDDIYELIHDYNGTIVQHDMPASAPAIHQIDFPFLYLRYHGPEKGYRGTYPQEHLQEEAVEIMRWLKQRKQVFAYFNNTLGDAYNNVMSMKEYVAY